MTRGKKHSAATEENYPDGLEWLRKDIQEIHTTLTSIKKEVSDLTKLVGRVDILETEVTQLKTSVEACHDSYAELSSKTLPDLSEHVASVFEHLTSYVLSIDAHRRKFNVILHGVKGELKELEDTTRKNTINFAQTHLGLSKFDAENTTMSACHRLSNKKDSGIILRFGDLSHRDKWLAGTRKLKDTAGNQKISVSTDLPPVIRPLKDELMLKRSKMDPELKLKTKLRYLPQFPFVELRAEGQNPIRPTKSLRDVTSEVLGNLNLAFPIPVG